MADQIELSHLPSQAPSIAPSLRPSSPALTTSTSIPAEDLSSSATTLPPVDRGHRAWLFLVAATTIEILVWGLPFSIGILHVYWTNTLFEGRGASTITLAATLQTGLMYMGCVFFGPLFTAMPRWLRTFQACGLAASVIAMVASAFPWHLIVTIGCIYPLSAAYYLPCATLIYEWFFTRRGLATGIMFAGTGVGGTVFPFIMSGLLSAFGYKAAMISLGVGYAIIGSIALLFIRRRIPLPRYAPGESRRRPRADWKGMLSLPLFMGLATILLTSLGNFVPSLWLPSYADDLKFTRPSGTGLISLMNAASVPGNALLGYLSDRYPVRGVILFSCLGSALSCAFLWGFGTNEGMLVAFALVFGLLGLSFSSVWSNMIGIIAKDDPIAPTLVFSLFAFARGVGNMTSGPISQSLLKLGALRGASGAYGVNNYGILLVYTAVTILSGCASGVFFKDRKS
ncbi:hypothetical protein IAT38_005955 [Cryptococcus sp. DSM 104549]